MQGNNPSAVATPPTSDIPSIVHQPTMADKILNEEHVARAVVFPEEEKMGILTRPKGIEMKRTLTQEDKELAAAGYDHLHPKDDKAEKITSVDITEHQLDFDGLVDELKTNISTKDAGQSHGLASDEAKARLQRDGANVLTPPRKKSALRKVRYICRCWPHAWTNCYPVPGTFVHAFQHPPYLRWYLGIYLARHRFSCELLSALLDRRFLTPA